MPTPDFLNSIPVEFSGGYFPDAASLAPKGLTGTIRAGDGVWLRPGGRLEVAKGLLQTSSQDVGARIFAADVDRATIAGGLNGDALPFGGFIRYQNAVYFYVHEDTSSQVYINETAVTGLTTSSTAGRLRVAIPDGVGGYSVFDAGFDKPSLEDADVTSFTFGPGALGQIAMQGLIGVAIAAWRTKTNAIGPPSEIVTENIAPSGSSLIRITLPTAVSGQDGWIYAGTRWNDQSGLIRVVRYIYITVRGTFTATNGSPNITAGVNTQFFRDLRIADVVTIDGGSYQIDNITSDTTATLTTNFTGSTNSGKTMTITDAAANWYDSEIAENPIVSRNVLRAPRAAGVLKYSDRVFLWGVSDTTSQVSSSATGNAIAAMLDDNPEHVGLLYIGTASGSDLLNVLATDGPLYLMTTTGLELLTFTNSLQAPFNLRIIAEPGFKSGANGVLYGDTFYGFNGQPFRTRAEENIDTQFAQPVLDEMKDWDGVKVKLAVDPKKQAVLYIYDNGTTTTVRPYMAAQGVWNPPLNFEARIVDTQVVNGTLYVTYLSNSTYRVNEWEGGSGIGGSPYVSSQYYDGSQLIRKRLKFLQATGKIASVSVYAARAGAAVPDVSSLLAAEATFTESDIADMTEAEGGTNIEARALAFRINLTSPSGDFQSLIARGTPRTQPR